MWSNEFTSGFWIITVKKGFLKTTKQSNHEAVDHHYSIAPSTNNRKIRKLEYKIQRASSSSALSLSNYLIPLSIMSARYPNNRIDKNQILCFMSTQAIPSENVSILSSLYLIIHLGRRKIYIVKSIVMRNEHFKITNNEEQFHNWSQHIATAFICLETIFVSVEWYLLLYTS